MNTPAIVPEPQPTEYYIVYVVDERWSESIPPDLVERYGWEVHREAWRRAYARARRFAPVRVWRVEPLPEDICVHPLIARAGGGAGLVEAERLHTFKGYNYPWHRVEGYSTGVRRAAPVGTCGMRARGSCSATSPS